MLHLCGELNKGCTSDRIEKREKKPITRWDSNPQPQEFFSAGMCSTTVLHIAGKNTGSEEILSYVTDIVGETILI